MATDYRFLDDTKNVDVTFITDASVNSKTFFVTERRNYDTQDTIQGVDVEVKTYTESEFRAIAVEKGINLYRSVNGIEACLVLSGVNAGKFNGSTSSLSVTGVDYTDGGGNFAESIITEVTFRMKSTDIEDVDSEFYLITSDDLDNVVGFRFVVGEKAPDNLSVELEFFPTISGDGWAISIGKSGHIFTLHECTCYTINVTVTRVVSDVLMSVIINEDQTDYNIRLPSFSAIPSTTVLFGEGDDWFFPGIMRNLLVTIDDVLVIDIKDPSTGVNDGTGNDGTPTDIESVTVIV